MLLFIFGAITGVFLSVLPTIGDAITTKVKTNRRTKLNRAVELEIYRRKMEELDAEWGASTW